MRSKKKGLLNGGRVGGGGLHPYPCMRGCKRAGKLGRHSLKVPRAGGGLRALGVRRLQREGENRETEEEKQMGRDGSHGR